MLKVSKLTVEGLEQNVVTDEKKPHFSVKLLADGQNVEVKSCHIEVKDCSSSEMWSIDTKRQIEIPYEGKPLEPMTDYQVKIVVTDNRGESAERETSFRTGLMGQRWYGKWISDGTYSFTEKNVSPEPMMFRKKVKPISKLRKAYIYSTALGTYECKVDGKKVGNRYFAPGFTSYKHNLQYQVMDVTDRFEDEKEKEISFTLCGGWAVGSFIYSRKNRFAADRQALLAQIHFLYESGEEEIIGTDETWDVTRKGPLKMSDLYDGEYYDSTVVVNDRDYIKAGIEKLRVNPKIQAECGEPVIEHEIFKPVKVTDKDREIIYDFGQNFAGIVRFTVRSAKKGQKIVIKHAEILNPDKSLNTSFLRSAKATVTYICSDGDQTFAPSFTYMGFRYISVSGADEKDIELEGVAVYSDIRGKGEFTCSDEMLNKLQNNIRWGAKSNFVEIPTDCPQRDERMGWTGDIAVFGPTACYNFQMGRFLKKWLKDVRSEQISTGGFPNTVPANGFGFPVTMPTMAIDWWGDASVLVPWALYNSEGDVQVLKDNYEMMKKYVNACKGWAGLLSFGKHRYIWNTPAVFHFGDWVAPDVPKMQQWQRRSKWTATASLCNTSAILSKIADILGKKDDAEYYGKLSAKVADAYESLLTDGNGKLLEEFQTAYVLPLQFNMFRKENREKALDNLVSLVEKNNYCIGTGFPGTPYILFALADNGREDVAYKMLLNQKCPSWLYEVKVGATTIWERWDGLDENGECPIGDDGTDMMISYNHYASGAVGDFLYRRIAGIEPIEAGYKTFRVKPLPGGNINSANASIDTPYGIAASKWERNGDKFTLTVTVPVGCKCKAVLPNGTYKEFGSGEYTLESSI